MPFEIAPQEISLAEKLAALIEVGRATHPDAKHIRDWGDGKHTGCAMTFAAMGAGLNAVRGRELVDKLAKILGTEPAKLEPLMSNVIRMNDDTRAPLAEIVAAIREDKWPAGVRRRPALNSLIAVDSAVYDAFSKVYAEEMAKMTATMFKNYIGVMPINGTIYYGGVDMAVDIWKPLKPLAAKPVVAKEPQPSKKLRVNSKTGASWPVAKHAYA